MRKCHANTIEKLVAEQNKSSVSSLETRFRSSQGDDQLELFPREQMESKWAWRIPWLTPLIIILVLAATASFATELPKMPEGGLTILSKMTCVDDESGQTGVCYEVADNAGNQYHMFYQYDEPMYIWKMLGDGYYEIIYMSDTFNSL